jgi:hypothetical protein
MDSGDADPRPEKVRLAGGDVECGCLRHAIPFEQGFIESTREFRELFEPAVHDV